MNTIVLEVDDPKKESLLLALLAELNFVRVVKTDTLQKGTDLLTPSAEKPTEQPTSATPNAAGGSIFDAAGIWAGRKITGEDLRTGAWER